MISLNVPTSVLVLTSQRPSPSSRPPWPSAPWKQEGVPEHGGLLEALAVHRGLHGDAHGRHPVLAHQSLHAVPDARGLLVLLPADGHLEPDLQLHHLRVHVADQQLPHARLDLLAAALGQRRGPRHAVPRRAAQVHVSPKVAAKDLLLGDQKVSGLAQHAPGHEDGLVEPRGEVKRVAWPGVEGHLAAREALSRKVARRVVGLVPQVVDHHVAQGAPGGLREGLEEVVGDGPGRIRLAGEPRLERLALRSPHVDGHDRSAAVLERQVEDAGRRIILVGLHAAEGHLNERVVPVTPAPGLLLAPVPIELGARDHETARELPPGRDDPPRCGKNNPGDASCLRGTRVLHATASGVTKSSPPRGGGVQQAASRRQTQQHMPFSLLLSLEPRKRT
eukprot:CAMPEP_0198461338 /NCGR_PEP_ID=MMETSP1456-20131121/97_1 /TAXON_ID=1461544 ORGANISM="Unidentified sp., Strain RCC1871" /NCGR_SAMPLE_ID=MMETSP1456 /ASSEMBLY_ACC=CAM_ASM_001119 /LENGTH=390 /DNA_ID=CAMNT_0044186359 /DNA_START=29 /DNA_END=1202 /DNA_ORIENTATION=+